MARYSDEFGEAVRAVLDAKKWTLRDAAVATGLSESTIGAMSKVGLVPGSGIVTDWALALGQPINHWRQLGGYDPIPVELVAERADGYQTTAETTEQPRMKAVPIRGIISGGQRVSLSEQPLGEILVPDQAENRADFALRVDGGDLLPFVLPGDLLGVRRSATAKDGQLCIIELRGEQLVKRFRRLSGKRICLSSDNPEYPPMEVSTADVKIVGVVAWLHRDMG